MPAATARGVDFIHGGGGEAGGPDSINNLIAAQVDWPT